ARPRSRARDPARAGYRGLGRIRACRRPHPMRMHILEETLMPRILRLLAAAALAGLPFLATTALSADIRQTPAVSGFSGIRLAVPAKMEVIQGDTESVALEGSAEDLARVETVVEDGVLQIR